MGTLEPQKIAPEGHVPRQSLTDPAEEQRAVRRSGRLRALLMLGLAALMFALFYYGLTSDHRFYGKALILSIFLSVLGIVGLIEPRVMLAMGQPADRARVPERFRVIGYAIMIPAVIFAVVLCLWLERH